MPLCKSCALQSSKQVAAQVDKLLGDKNVQNNNRPKYQTTDENSAIGLIYSMAIDLELLYSPLYYIFIIIIYSIFVTLYFCCFVNGCTTYGYVGATVLKV